MLKWNRMQIVKWESVLWIHQKGTGLSGWFYLYNDGRDERIPKNYTLKDIIRHHESGGEFGYSR